MRCHLCIVKLHQTCRVLKGGPDDGQRSVAGCRLQIAVLNTISRRLPRWTQSVHLRCVRPATYRLIGGLAGRAAPSTQRPVHLVDLQYPTNHCQSPVGSPPGRRRCPHGIDFRWNINFNDRYLMRRTQLIHIFLQCSIYIRLRYSKPTRFAV